ncbi:MAG: sugar phosphate nucleotidyltransferase [Alphaproteobacteria bacterium]
MATLDIDAIVLAGGLGTRLRPAVPRRQKTVAPIGNAAVLGHVLALVEAAGISRIILAVGHRADDVVSFVGARRGGKVEYLFSTEDTPLGTGGAIRHALPLVRSSDVLVLNGDSFVKCDPTQLVAFHRRKAAKIAMLAVEVADTSRYGRIDVGSDDVVRAFREKGEEVGEGWVNAGVYVIGRKEIEAVPPGTFSLERDILPGYCGKGLYALKTQAPFIDIGTPESFRAAEEFFKTHG